MTITNIESITKTRYRVYVDDEFAFVLYKGELFKYQLKKNEEVSEETINQIKSEVLVKRAKLRAMHLLNMIPRTEQQLREKLMQSEYPEDITEIAVQYVKSFGYINDDAYIHSKLEIAEEVKAILEEIKREKKEDRNDKEGKSLH